MTSETTDKTIRISLPWILLGLLAVFGIGFAGGWLGSWLNQPILPLPGGGGQDRLITTVQEVTISPNTAAIDVVQSSERSVVMIIPPESEQPTATGLIVTSDGLVVTPAGLPTGHLTAIDFSGQTQDLNHVATDEVFGLAYYRLGRGVFVPLEVVAERLSTGARMLALSRQPETLAPRVHDFLVEEIALPQSAAPRGWQFAVLGRSADSELFNGAPLLDEEGRVTGLLTVAVAGEAMGSQQLRESLDRVIQQRHEHDLYAELGFRVAFEFIPAETKNPRQFAARIQAVQGGTPAAESGLRVGDFITAVNEQPVSFETSFFTQLSQAGSPIVVDLMRGEVEQSITIQQARNE